MIDIENQLYTNIKRHIESKFQNILISGEPMLTIPQFPYVQIVQEDNSEDLTTRTNRENFSNLMYEVDIYSNKASGKKTECKNILKEVNLKFQEMGFQREMARPLLNLADNTIYRIKARYVGKVGRDKTIYRR